MNSLPVAIIYQGAYPPYINEIYVICYQRKTSRVSRYKKKILFLVVEITSAMERIISDIKLVGKYLSTSRAQILH